MTVNEADSSRDDLLAPPQVCAEYPLFGSPAALADRRWRGEGPDYIKTSESRSGRVYYRRSAIERWIEEHTVRTGGEVA